MAKPTLNTLIFVLISFICFGQQVEDSALRNRMVEGIKMIEKSDFKNGILVLNEVLEIASKKQNYDILVTTQLNIGVFYYRLSDTEKALNKYFEAADLAKKHNLKQLLNSIYNNIGIIYSTNHNQTEAKNYFTNALNISRELNDDYKVGINLLNLGNYELDLKQYSTAIAYLDEAEQIFDSINNKRYLAEINSLKGIIAFENGDFKKAKANQLTACCLMEKSGDKLYLANYTFRLGNAYYKLNEYDSALINFKYSLTLARQLNNKEILIQDTKAIAETLVKKNNYPEAIENFRQATIWNDSLLLERSSKWISEMQMKYEFEKQSDEIDFLIRRNHWYLAIWTLSIILLALIAFFMWYGLRSRHQRAVQRNIILQKEKELQLLEIQKAEAENKCLAEEIKSNEERNSLKQEHLQAELEHKNRELALNALHIINKNEILSDIKNKLSDAKKAKQEDLSNQVKSIIHSIDNDSNLDKEWETFKLHFENLHGDFFVRLQNDYPLLNQSDLRLCAYLFINLNNKEIARILNIAPDSMRKRKQRLREKLNVETENEIVGLLNRYR